MAMRHSSGCSTLMSISFFMRYLLQLDAAFHRTVPAGSVAGYSRLRADLVNPAGSAPLPVGLFPGESTKDPFPKMGDRQARTPRGRPPGPRSPIPCLLVAPGADHA